MPLKVPSIIERLFRRGMIREDAPLTLDAINPLPLELSQRFTRSILSDMKMQRDEQVRNGLYESTIVSFVFNHERIEGNQTTEWQTRDIIETRDRVLGDSTTPSDVRETANHSLMFDYLIDHVDESLTLGFIQSLHEHLMRGVMEGAGQWKILPNAVPNVSTAAPSDVPRAMEALVHEYERFQPSLENIARFHVRFETIHPFPDGNGRTGRAIMFRECLRAGIVPFIVTDATKERYYKGLSVFRSDERPLIDYLGDMQAEYLRMSIPLMTDRVLAKELLSVLPDLIPEPEPEPAFSGPLKEQSAYTDALTDKSITERSGSVADLAAASAAASKLLDDDSRHSRARKDRER